MPRTNGGGETLARKQNDGGIPPSRGAPGWGRFIPPSEDGGRSSWPDTPPPPEAFGYPSPGQWKPSTCHLLRIWTFFGKPFWVKKTNASALGLEQEGMDEQKKKAWVKEGVLISL